MQVGVQPVRSGPGKREGGGKRSAEEKREGRAWVLPVCADGAQRDRAGEVPPHTPVCQEYTGIKVGCAKPTLVPLAEPILNYGCFLHTLTHNALPDVCHCECLLSSLQIMGETNRSN